MIFVTGGTGLTGAHLLYRLTSTGKRVTALIRPQSSTNLVRQIFRYYTASPDLLLERITWVEGNLGDYYNLMEGMEGADWVYHCAGLVSFDKKDKNALFETNVNGTTNVVNASLEQGVRKLCFVSSVAALAAPASDAPADEEAIAKAADFEQRPYYAKTKFLAETIVWRGYAEGMNILIVNPSIIIGPGKWNQGTGQLFSLLYKGLNYYPPGSSGFVDVRDVADLMVQLVESDIANERFVLNGANMSYYKLFSHASSALGLKKPLQPATKKLLYTAYRADALRSLILRKPQSLTKNMVKAALQNSSYSAEKIRNHLGNRFLPLKESIEHTARLFLQDINK